MKLGLPSIGIMRVSRIAFGVASSDSVIISAATMGRVLAAGTKFLGKVTAAIVLVALG